MTLDLYLFLWIDLNFNLFVPSVKMSLNWQASILPIPVLRCKISVLLEGPGLGGKDCTGKAKYGANFSVGKPSFIFL